MTQEDEGRGRSLMFHWVANMFFAAVALLGGVLFGLEVDLGRAVLVIAAGAAALIPVTRRWERSGIAARQARSDGPTEQDLPEESSSDP